MVPKPAKVGADDFVASGRGADLPTIPRTAPGSAQPVELNALLTRTYDERPAIIGDGIIPRGGLIILGGPPKRGKSLLALQQVLTRTLGWNWLGFPTTPGRSLVIQAEIPERELQLRLRTMQAQLDAPIPADAVHFVTERRLRLDQPDGLRTVRNLIEGLEPDLVQIDPLARFISGDENSTREMSRLIAGLDELIQAYGVAVEVVHHTAKPSSDDRREGSQRLRGSSALSAAADSVLILDRDGEDRFRLGFELRHGRELAPLRLHRTRHLWLEPAGPPEELLQVREIVRTVPLMYGQFVMAIKAEHKVSMATAERRVQAAFKAGLITKNDDGSYRANSLTLVQPSAEHEGKA